MDKEYIERGAAIAYLEKLKRIAQENNFILSANEDAIIKFLKEKCPTADVVEVVRCKDCIHATTNKNHENKPLICCLTKMCGTVMPNWYCADGRKGR